jgi:oxaloacetate decarboxylase gamma subunit
VDNSLIGQGLELMLYGMGTVVVFLSLLVVVTASMSSVVQRFVPQPPESGGAKPDASPASITDGTTLAVIAAAIHRHRSIKQNRDSNP